MFSLPVMSEAFAKAVHDSQSRERQIEHMSSGSGTWTADVSVAVERKHIEYKGKSRKAESC